MEVSSPIVSLLPTWAPEQVSSTLDRCLLIDNVSDGFGGGARYGTLTTARSSATPPRTYGGGASDAVLDNCTLINNSAGYGGGGAASCTLTQCLLSSNWGPLGGGAFSSTLRSCILTNNSADNGGGSYLGVLDDCILVDNWATTAGGGAEGGTLNSCVLTGNATPGFGGAVDGQSGPPLFVLNNCTLVGNSALTAGGGAYAGGGFVGMLNNCIVYDNTAPLGANYSSNDPPNGTNVLAYCCTTPLPPDNISSNNIIGPPLFINEAAGNLRLQSNSPCIDAAFNGFATNTTDLDGNLRIIGPSVDMGAYEFQGPPLAVFRAWLKSYGLPTDGSADYVDTDRDGMNNWQEWACGTVPTNAQSVLRLLVPTANPPTATLAWQSVANRTYFIERSTNLAGHPPFLLLQTNLAGQTGTTTWADTNAPWRGPCFYRVGVQQ